MVKQLVKKSSVYLAAKIIAAGIAFFTLPLLTRLLSQEDVGLIVYFNAIAPMAVAVVYLGTEGAMVRLYFEYKEKEKLFSNISFLVIIIFLLVSIILIVQRFYFKQEEQIFYDLLTLFVLFSALKTYLMSYYRITENSKAFFIFFISITVLAFALQVLGAYFYKDPYAVLEAKVIVELIASVVAGYYFYKYVNFTFISKDDIKNILNYALPILPYAIALYAINMTDKLFVKHYLGLEEVAIYGVAFTFIAAISIFSSSIDMAWGPYFYKNIETKAREHFSRLITFIYALLTLVTLFIITFSKEIILLVYSDEYATASSILSILMFGAYIYTFYFFPVKSINYKKKNKLTALLAVCIMFLNIAMNFYFVQSLGSIGCAIATTLSNIFFVLALILIAERVFEMNYEYKILIIFVSIVFINLILINFIDMTTFYKFLFLLVSYGLVGLIVFFKYKQFQKFEKNEAVI